MLKLENRYTEKTIVIGKNMCFDSMTAKLWLKKELDIKINIRTKYKRNSNITYALISNISKDNIKKICDYFEFRFNLRNVILKFVDHDFNYNSKSSIQE